MRVETKILINNYPEEFPFCDMSTGENTVGTDVCVCACARAFMRARVCEFLVIKLIFTIFNFLVSKYSLYLVAVAC